MVLILALQFSVLVLLDQVKHEAAMFNAIMFNAIMFNPITPVSAAGEPLL
jgi:hypothetical protein